MRLEFNTNGSVYPSSIIELIKKFKQVEILISIDAVGEKFEIQRGGQWHTIDKNIKLFSQLKNDNFIVKLSPTVNIQNVLYLEELVEYAQMQSYEIVWWYLENPDYLCIDNVTSAVKELIFTKYSNHHVSELCDIAVRVNQTNPVTGKKFIDYMKKLDQRRAQNFRESHVEIYDAMASE
jgi:MoaA/NifB/PqqE/SkfB family radical SAM enzyme